MLGWGLNRDQKFYLRQCVKKLPLSVLVSLAISGIAVFYASAAHGIIVFMLLMAGAVLRIAYETMDFKQLYYASDQTRLNVGRLATVILFFAMFGCVIDVVFTSRNGVDGLSWHNHMGIILSSIFGALFCLAFVIIGFISDKLGLKDSEPS